MNRFMIGLETATMKKILAMSLLMAGCMNPSTVTESSQPVEPKSALFFKYAQYVQTEIVPDSTKKSDYPIVMVDPADVFSPPWVIDSMRRESMNNFVKNEMDGKKGVFFYDLGWNSWPINNDVGWGTGRYAVAAFPFQFSATQYNGRDSNRICIDSIAPDHCAFLSINSKKHVLRAGDSLCHIDTAYGRTDSTWCWQRLIITRKLINAGMDFLPNQKYLRFF